MQPKTIEPRLPTEVFEVGFKMSRGARITYYSVWFRTWLILAAFGAIHLSQWFRDPEDRLGAEMAKFVAFNPDDFKYKTDCDINGNRREDCLRGNYSYFMHEMRSKCSEIFTSCYYNGQKFSCCNEFQKLESYRGPCYAVNSVAAKNQSDVPRPFLIERQGYGYGNLSVEFMNVEYYVIVLGTNAVPSPKNAKYAILGTDVRSLQYNSSYNVYLSLEAILTEPSATVLDPIERGCRFQRENNLVSSSTYSSSACENECFIKAHLENCNCVKHMFPGVDKKTECDLDGLICIAKSTTAIEEYYQSRCNCLSSCLEEEVMKLGATKYDTFSFRDKRSDARINFIIRSPSVRFTRTVVRSPLDMIVTVGGVLGLFIGASLLSVVELIYYLIVRPMGDKFISRNTQTKQKNRAILEKTNMMKTKKPRYPHGIHYIN